MLATEERRGANYIDFIGDGKGTCALGEALSGAEQKVAALRAELQGYKRGALNSNEIEMVAPTGPDRTCTIQVRDFIAR